MRKSKYTKEFLEPVVKKSKSYSEVIRNLGLKLSGGSQCLIKDKIVLLKLDTSHFTGQLWSKGKTKDTHASIAKQALSISYDTKDILKNNVCYRGRILGKALIASGVTEECQICKLLPVWNGKPLKFHVDHINGNRRDCRKENLRFLCPNCHQQTPTWGNGNLE